MDLLTEVKNLEKKGSRVFSYHPPSKMKALYALKVLSEAGYDPKSTRERGMTMIQCELNLRKKTYQNGEDAVTKIIFVSHSNPHPHLNRTQLELLEKNSDLIYHLLENEGRYLWLSHLGSKTKQGAAAKANLSLQKISEVKKYKNVHASLVQEIFKFLGLPVPREAMK